MRKLLLLIQFDGTDFHGWQVQSGLRSVQQTLEEALGKLTGEQHRCESSSRTDAGVHARAMPASARTARDIPLYGVLRGLNSLLPHDMSVSKVVESPPGFDVRRSATGKTYRYSIWNAPTRAALYTRTYWHVPYAIDLDAMREAAGALVGEHDFTAYRASSCQARTTVRHVRAIGIEGQPGGEIVITVEGNAFLQHMVRILVGTLVDIGRGHRPVSFAGDALAARTRIAAGPTAPPRGLVLHQVHYPGSPFDD